MTTLLAFVWLAIAAPTSPAPATDAASLNRRALEKLTPAPAKRAHTTPVLLSGGMTEHDYPYEALRVEATGRVFVSYTVSVDGRARDCRILRSSRHLALDAKTCWIINTRYRMSPARDQAGELVETRAYQYITWQLPD